MTCDLTVVGQENFCNTCGVRWDLSDRDAPECGERLLSRAEISTRLKEYRKTLLGGVEGTA